MVKQYKIKYFYDITDRSDFKANPDYKGVCHIALAQEGFCKPGVHYLLRWLSAVAEAFVVAQGVQSREVVNAFACSVWTAC